MVLRAVLTPKHTMIYRQRFKRTDILPEEYLKSSAPLYILPLHARDESMGYLVLKTKEIAELKYFFPLWAIGLANAIDRQKMYHENRDLLNMRMQFNRDELTGIGNRREIEKILRNRHQRFTSYGERFCVVSIDMDGLKIINDTYGHLAGDEALKALAGILEKNKGFHGDVARIGGDEFVMCLGLSDKKEIERIIANVEKGIATHNEKAEKPYQLSASIGYCCCKKGMPLIECMQISDERMYNEKRKRKQRNAK